MNSTIRIDQKQNKTNSLFGINTLEKLNLYLFDAGYAKATSNENFFF